MPAATAGRLVTVSLEQPELGEPLQRVCLPRSARSASSRPNSLISTVRDTFPQPVNGRDSTSSWAATMLLYTCAVGQATCDVKARWSSSSRCRASTCSVIAELASSSIRRSAAVVQRYDAIDSTTPNNRSAILSRVAW
jgi:hypothetical protein